MSDQVSVVVCERCGNSFILSANYRDWLARRGVKVIQPMLCMTCFMKVGPLPKQRGVVKWFNPNKHCDFLSPLKAGSIPRPRPSQIRGTLYAEGQSGPCLGPGCSERRSRPEEL